MKVTKKKLLCGYSTLAFLEGIVAIIFLFRIPSESENSWLYGFSKGRIIIGSFALLVEVFFFVLTLISFFQAIWPRLYIKDDDGLLRQAQPTLITFAPKLLKRLIDWIKCVFFEVSETFQKKSIPLFLITMFFSFCFAGVIFIAIMDLESHYFNSLRVVYTRIQALFIWGVLLAFQTAIGLIIANLKTIKEPFFWNHEVFWKAVFLSLVLELTVFQWMIFVTQDGFFTLIDGWYWQYHAKPFAIRDFLFLLNACFACFIIWFILEKNTSVKRSLLFLFLLAYFLQISMGFVEGQGFESLREKFMESGHNYYATHASDDPFFFEALRSYEGTYTTNFILGTKPPGGLAFYMIMQHISNIPNPEDSFAGRYARLTNFASFIFPFFASGAVYFVYWFSKRILGNETFLLGATLLIFSPNFILIVLQMDQFLYPMLFLGGLSIAACLARQRTLWLALILGGYFYLCLYMSFSLIPLISLCAIWMGLVFWFKERSRDISTYFRVGAGVIIGFAFTYVLFYIFLNYDALLRYQNALAWHRTIKIFDTSFGGIVNSVLINNIEFTLWTGVPVILLASVFILNALKNVIHKNATGQDWFGLAFIINYLILNLFGQTRSEVGRLWFFQVPILALFAGIAYKKLFHKNTFLLITLLSLQLITTFITFKFQDFY